MERTTAAPAHPWKCQHVVTGCNGVLLVRALAPAGVGAFLVAICSATASCKTARLPVTARM